MHNGLRDLYELPPKELYLLELAEQCSRLEYQLLEIAESLSIEQRMIIEAYIEIRGELEFQSVKRALKIGKRM